MTDELTFSELVVESQFAEIAKWQNYKNTPSCHS